MPVYRGLGRWNVRTNDSEQLKGCFYARDGLFGERRKWSVVEIREREIELKLRRATADRGGLCLKFTPGSWAGAPDRLVLLPGGVMGFVEVKAPGQRPRPLQVRRHTQLAELGYVVLVLDDPERVDSTLDEIEQFKRGGDENAQPG